MSELEKINTQILDLERQIKKLQIKKNQILAIERTNKAKQDLLDAKKEMEDWKNQVGNFKNPYKEYAKDKIKREKLKEYVKEVQDAKKRKAKITILKSLLITPKKVQRLNFKN